MFVGPEQLVAADQAVRLAYLSVEKLIANVDGLVFRAFFNGEVLGSNYLHL
jgi:hypothetical protein